jgi:hypothetical protein
LACYLFSCNYINWNRDPGCLPKNTSHSMDIWQKLKSFEKVIGRQFWKNRGFS